MKQPIDTIPKAERWKLVRAAEDWASWLAVWMVYWANNKPENKKRKPKVGGHQASVVSSSSVLTAAYLEILRPQDRIAVKPHAAPYLYALLYMMGLLSRTDMENLRELGGPPAYPTQHTHPGLIDYSTSIEGLGCAATVADAYEASVQNAQLGGSVDATYHALVGDGELTELQIGGTLYEAGRRRLGSVCWWIDLNRQSLDRVMEDSPGGSTAQWAHALFEANGWHVVDIRWGTGITGVFSARGGEALRTRLESLSDSHYQSLLLVDGGTIRLALEGRTKHEDPVMARFLEDFARTAPTPEDLRVLDNHSDEELETIIQDLGGHDLALLEAAYQEASAFEDRPTAIICHTVKGWRLPAMAGHPENHGAVLSGDRMAEYRLRVGFPEGDPFALPAEGGDLDRLMRERAKLLFSPESLEPVACPVDISPSWDDARVSASGKRSTSAVFGNLNLTYLRLPIGPRLAFIAPDVGLTTHLGGVIRATGVFDANPPPDLTRFLREQNRQPFEWRLTERGQFHSVAINEGVAALLAFAFGREKFSVEGKQRLIPIVTIYDIFWKHAYTQVYYALYDRARFIAVGTPSGTSLSRESGTHQSIQTPALFMGMPNIIYYEPAFAYDVRAIYHWAIGQLMDDEGEAVYLRLTTQELDQPELEDTKEMRRAVIRGGYWFIDQREASGYDAGRNAASVFATGPIIAEAIRAAEILREQGIFLNVCNVTSWERLKRDWEEYWRTPEVWDDSGSDYHLNALIPDNELDSPMVVVGDFTPQVAEWVGSALGRHVPVLGPNRFSETGEVEAIRRFHGIDADSIARSVTAEFRTRRLS